VASKETCSTEVLEQLKKVGIFVFHFMKSTLRRHMSQPAMRLRHLFLDTKKSYTNTQAKARISQS
jgi:hypothetical protein